MIINEIHYQIITTSSIYIIKEFIQPKMSLNREFLIWKERGRGGWAVQQAVILKVRLGRDRERDKETKRQS
jgi:hypothetical protein